jgi:ribosome biogenesis SPOUT family RNA methylase Rps3
MSTDTAVLVAKMITDGKKFSDITFKDEIEIELEPNESIELPYRYVVENGQIVLPEGFIEFIKKHRGFDE